MQKRIRPSLNNMTPSERAIRKNQVRSYMRGTADVMRYNDWKKSGKPRSMNDVARDYIKNPIKGGKFRTWDETKQRNNPTMIRERKMVKLA